MLIIYIYINSVEICRSNNYQKMVIICLLVVLSRFLYYYKLGKYLDELWLRLPYYIVE